MMRKTILAGTVFGLFLTPILVPVAFAQAPAETTVASPTADLVGEANRFLSHGKKLNKAISFYEEAMRREPKNAAYQTYLACAKAGRTFAMAQYLRDEYLFDNRTFIYERDKERWGKAQKDKTAVGYGSPAPLTPVRPEWLEDGAKPANTEAVKALIKDAQKEAFVQVQKAADQVSPASYTHTDKNDLLTLQGWSALMLYVGPYRFVDAPEKEKALTLMKTVLKQTLLSPADVRQMERVADALVISYAYPVTVSDELFNPNRETFQQGLDLTIAYVPKARNKGAIWYWIATNQANPMHGAPLDNNAALASYKKAVEYDPSNARYHYVLASHLAVVLDALNETQRKTQPNKNTEVLDYVKKGNACGAIGSADYDVAAPPLLRWAFTPYPFGDWYNIAILQSIFEVLEYDKIESGQTAEVIALVRDASQCGQHYLDAAQSPSMSAAQKQRYLGAGKSMMIAAGDALVSLKVKGQTTPPELDTIISFVPEHHRRGIKVP